MLGICYFLFYFIMNAIYYFLNTTNKL